MNYLLDDNNNVECTMDLEYWAKKVTEVKKRTRLQTRSKGLLISTVFLSTDYGDGLGDPVLFETMVFPDGEWRELYCERYSTYSDAQEGHKKAVNLVEEGKIQIGEYYPREGE